MSRNGRIVFGIPSFKEADSISQLTKVVDRGLLKYFPSYESVILNVDNDSPDGTEEAFLSTKTRTKKVYLASKGKNKNLRGKGYHLKMAFRYADQIGAEALAFIDGDVTSATPEWVKKLIEPVLRGYDHVLPIYLRNQFDGSITNHLVYPVLYGILKVDIRQPLAGEVALSRKAIKAFLKAKWYWSAYHYGIDIFMVATSIFNSLKIGQVFLGVKSHKPSAPKLEPMFAEVADSLFRQLKANSNFWRRRKLAPKPARVFSAGNSLKPPKLVFDYKKMKAVTLREYRKNKPAIKKLLKPFSLELEEVFSEKSDMKMTAKLWAELVCFLVAKQKLLTKSEMLALRAVFFARFITFYEAVNGSNYKLAEEKIVNQARLFRKFRNLAL